MAPSKALCSYVNCKRNRANNPDISFFRFPSNKERSEKWVERCGNLKLKSLNTEQLRQKTVCAVHFTHWSFMNKLKNSLVHNAAPVHHSADVEPSPPPSPPESECFVFKRDPNLKTYEHCVLKGADTKPAGAFEEVSQPSQDIQMHPGTIVYNLDRFGGWSSLESMWYQVGQLKADVMNISQKHPEGIHFVGYSQGGLVARAILQTFPEHNVHNFISLSSPQAGQYGTEFLHIIFPNLALKTAYELFYSRVGQHTSVGNYWNDPHHQLLYFGYSQFLPYLNNEILSNSSETFRKSMLKLHKLVLIGGPDDDVITPWESSQFGYFTSNETVTNLINRDIYIKDTIGLKTLDKEGKLKLVTVAGVNHFMWHINASIVDNCLLPYLD